MAAARARPLNRPVVCSRMLCQFVSYPLVTSTSLSIDAAAKPIPPMKPQTSPARAAWPSPDRPSHHQRGQRHPQAAGPVVPAGRGHAQAQAEDQDAEAGPPSDGHAEHQPRRRIEPPADRPGQHGADDRQQRRQPVGVVPVERCSREPGASARSRSLAATRATKTSDMGRTRSDRKRLGATAARAVPAPPGAAQRKPMTNRQAKP